MISIMTPPEVKYEDDYSRLECVCLHCGETRNAECPACGMEYSPQSPIKDYGFKPGTPQSMLEKFASLARYITSKRNSKFLWGCFLIAIGDSRADGISMTEFAKGWGVTKACVSQECVAICARLGIPPSQYMKTEKGREKFKESNVRRRKQKTSAVSN